MGEIDNYLERLLKDRNNPREIGEELKIRKKIERKTGHRLEIQRSKDLKGIDLKCYMYKSYNGNLKKGLIGHIEVEVSENWIDTYPNNWKEISFLKRKIEKYDWDRRKWIGLRDDIDTRNAFYLVINKNRTNCFSQTIHNIYTNFRDSKRKLKDTVTGRYLRDYNNCYLICDYVKEYNKVFWGWSDVIYAMNKQWKKQEPEIQKSDIKKQQKRIIGFFK